MEFTLIPIGSSTPSIGLSQAFLVGDRWDDWGKYRTQFYLVVFDENGTKHEPGELKIGQFELEACGDVAPGKRAPAVPTNFRALGGDFFSLGQTESYYEALNELRPELRDEILSSLRDVARDLDLFERAESQEVMQESLLRSVRAAGVRNRLHRLAMGDATLTAYRFRYTLALPPQPIENYEPPSLDFCVTPNSVPPTNIHVLIGRNGVGKSRCMQHLAKAVLGVEEAGTIEPITSERPRVPFFTTDEEPWTFSELISVSFSAFDEFDLPSPTTDEIKANSIGLRTRRQINPLLPDTEAGEGAPDATHLDEHFVTALKAPQELSADFTKSFGKCRTEPRRGRWLQAVETLCNDPLFSDANPQGLSELSDNEWEEAAARFFRNLSSGHKIVLLTITRLVELVHERTLVLLDEPEGHLHPPLLSAFIRSLSDLLIRRNGVAIIATHSPVVLQEVPSSCVWMLNRSGLQASVRQPPLETFGENVGVLTSAVFGLEVTTAGYHELLKQAINTEGLTYEQLIERLDNQLGAEGKAIARALVNERNRGGDAQD